MVTRQGVVLVVGHPSHPLTTESPSLCATEMPGSCPLGALSLVNTVAGYLKSWVWKPNVLSGTSCRELYFSDVFPHPSLTVALNYLYKTRRPQRRTNTGQTPRWVTAPLPHCLHSDFSKEMPEMSQGREDVWECVHASNRENLWRKVLWLPCYGTLSGSPGFEHTM